MLVNPIEEFDSKNSLMITKSIIKQESQVSKKIFYDS